MYNPYDLVKMTVNNKEIFGRPIALDSDVVNNNDLTNAFGNIVKPTKLSTVCPDCGQGLEFDVILDIPPFSTVNRRCYICSPETAIVSADPFMNPVADGRISEFDLDPLLHDPSQQVVSEEESSVADRFKVETTDLEDPLLRQEDIQEAGQAEKVASESSPKKKTTKKAKKRTRRPNKKPTKSANKKAEKELAQGVGGEEIEFDDDDLVETE